MEQKAVSEELS